MINGENKNMKCLIFRYKNDYTKYSGKLKGKAVEDNFEYNSFNNEWYLTVDEIKNYIATLK